MARIFFLVAALGLASGCGQDGTAPTAPSPTAPPPAEPAARAVHPWETAWIEANAHPFDGPHLSLPNEGIAFLRDIVGDARIVSLGENTHGARDFFEMKARILRFLVEEMGFNTFAIEATWPESRRLDRYVRTGEGDPAKLLAGLYFWTWNTESVLEMIEWMRAHNEAGGDIGFHGFDMQYPGMALHNVREYIREVDPGRTEVVAGQLHCLAIFANTPSGRRPGPQYRDQSEAYRELWRRLARRGPRTASCESGGIRGGGGGGRLRGGAAEPAGRVPVPPAREPPATDRPRALARRGHGREHGMDQPPDRARGPDGPLAHNTHVSNWQGTMGSHLRGTFGDDMVIVGFSHEGGGVHGGGGDGIGRGSARVRTRGSPSGLLRALLVHRLFPRLVLDLRNRNPNAAGSSWLAGRRMFRGIGAVYNPKTPSGTGSSRPSRSGSM